MTIAKPARQNIQQGAAGKICGISPAEGPQTLLWQWQGRLAAQSIGELLPLTEDGRTDRRAQTKRDPAAACLDQAPPICTWSTKPQRLMCARQFRGLSHRSDMHTSFCQSNSGTELARRKADDVPQEPRLASCCAILGSHVMHHGSAMGLWSHIITANATIDVQLEGSTAQAYPCSRTQSCSCPPSTHSCTSAKQDSLPEVWLHGSSGLRDREPKQHPPI